MAVIDTIKLECGAQIIVEKDTNISMDVVNISVIDIDGKKILNRDRHGEKEWNACKGYYAYKLDYLLDPNKTITLNEPYVMFECNDRMYAITDLEYTENHRDLRRSCKPIGFYSDDDYVVNLMTFGAMHSIFTYHKDILVFRFDTFYLNGKRVGTYTEIKHGLEMSRTDIDYHDEKVKTYFENKLGIKLKGFKSEMADAFYDTYDDNESSKLVAVGSEN